jgi:hypothetical protein
MSRLTKILLLLTVAAGLAVPAALSSNAQWNTGPTCTTSNGGTSLSCSGKATGLGSDPVVVRVTANFVCTNNGNNQPPGQASFLAGPISPHNGQITFSVGPVTANCQGQALSGTWQSPAYITLYTGQGCTVTRKGTLSSSCVAILGPTQASF